MRVVVMMVLLGMVGPLLAGDFWHQWRGPERNGSDLSWRLPEHLPEQLSRRWTVEVGMGYGSPVVDGERVYLLTGNGEQEQIQCLNLADGKLLWQHTYSIAFTMNQYALSFGKGPFATPLLHRGKLITVGVTGVVSCLNPKDGNLNWRETFEGTLSDQRVLFCGNTVSPLALGDLVVVHLGNEKQGRMTAYEVDSGKRRWSWDGDIAGYASPVLARLAGQTQIVTVSQNKIVGIDPDKGNLLWQHPYQVEWRENIVSPLVYKSSVIVAGREQNAISALNILNDQDRFSVREQWRNSELTLYMSSPILHKGTLFGFAHQRKGYLFAMNPENGEKLWAGPGRMGEHAVLIGVADVVLMLTNDAKLRVVDPREDQFTVKASWEVAPRETWTHPALIKEGLIIKDKTHLSRLGF